MKVLVFEFHQESNSFCPVISTMEDYERCSVVSGEVFRESVRGKQLAAEGIFCALDLAGITAIPGYGMRAPSGGPVEESVLEHFLRSMKDLVNKHQPLSGAFISLHGATQSTLTEDVCGEILYQLRQEMGNEAVITASCDLHANVTERMLQNVDFLCGYHTYPHIDLYNTGFRAASLGIKKLHGDKNLMMQWLTLPMIVPASGYTTQGGVFGKLMEEARKKSAILNLADYSVFQMQPWLDVSAAGSTLIAVGTEAVALERFLLETGQGLLDIRKVMKPVLSTVEEALRKAETESSGKPVVIVDFSDSPNAGAAGDNCTVLEQLLKEYPDMRAAFILNDTECIEKACSCGVGESAEFHLGGTRDPSRSHPITIKAKVRSLHDGSFILEGPSMRGVESNVGKAAVLSIGNVDILVCQAMSSTGDPQLYRHFGIEPTLYQLVLVKANTSFLEAYGSFSETICYVDTKCAATADLTSLPFSHLPDTFFPFASLDEFRICRGMISCHI